MNCMKCGKETGDYAFRVLPVQTRRVRNIGGERPEQALGDFADYCVCRSCAEERYRRITGQDPAARKAVLRNLLVIILGAAAAAFFRERNSAFRMLGIGMLICGGLGAYGTLQSTRVKKKEIRALSPEQALRQCAWECLLDAVPKKSDGGDITYIPVDEGTLARKKVDLRILYNLLPKTADEVCMRIHDIQGESPTGETGR